MKTGSLAACIALLLSGIVATAFGQQASSAPEKSKAASSTKPATKDSSKAAAPQTPPPAATDNPFPEAQSAAAAKQEKQNTAAASGSTADGATNPDLKLQPIPGASSSNQNMSDNDLGGATVTFRKHQDEYTRDLSPAGRLKDDLDVADLYMKDWNFHGAYMRYKDALQQDDTNEAAIFGAGKSACMLNNLPEATAQLKDYLNLYPTGKSVKEAKKLLSNPKSCAGNQ